MKTEYNSFVQKCVVVKKCHFTIHERFYTLKDMQSILRDLLCLHVHHFASFTAKKQNSSSTPKFLHSEVHMIRIKRVKLS